MTSSRSILITFLTGSRQGQELRYNIDEKISVGRGTDNTIVVDGSTNHAVSRNHATLEYHNDGWVLTDSSTNGTFVNNVLLNKSESEVSDGDHLQFSKTGDQIKINITTDTDDTLHFCVSGRN